MSILFALNTGSCATLPLAETWQRTAPNSVESYSDSLELISHIEGTGLSIAVQGDYAYWGFSHELVVLDIHNLVAPVRVASLPIPTNDIVLESDYAYLVGRGGLYIVDIQQPRAPIVKSRRKPYFW